MIEVVLSPVLVASVGLESILVASVGTPSTRVKYIFVASVGLESVLVASLGTLFSDLFFVCPCNFFVLLDESLVYKKKNKKIIVLRKGFGRSSYQQILGIL